MTDEQIEQGKMMMAAALTCAKGEVDVVRSREMWAVLLAQVSPEFAAAVIAEALPAAFEAGEERGAALVLKGLKQNGL